MVSSSAMFALSHFLGRSRMSHLFITNSVIMALSYSQSLSSQKQSVGKGEWHLFISNMPTLLGINHWLISDLRICLLPWSSAVHTLIMSLPDPHVISNTGELGC
jgi:hypothetical protein